MIKESVSVHMARPIDEVFNVSSDISRLADWNGPLNAAWQTSEPPMTVGSTYKVEIQMPLGLTQTVENEVTEFDPPISMAVETRSGLSYRMERQLEETESGTRITDILEADPGPLATLFVKPMLSSFARTQAENLNSLKELVEAS